MNSSLLASSTASMDDNASQSSQRSSASLLERIQAQRQREAAAAAAAAAQPPQPQPPMNNHNHHQNQMQTMSSAPTNTPSHIQVPQYSPVPTGQEGFGSHSGGGGGGDSNFFASAWRNISASMESGMASHRSHDGYDAAPAGDDMEESLLAAPTSSHNTAAAMGYGRDGEYSMTNYFMTVVRDVSNLFHSLPVWGRVVVVIVLLFIAIRLL